MNFYLWIRISSVWDGGLEQDAVCSVVYGWVRVSVSEAQELDGLQGGGAGVGPPQDSVVRAEGGAIEAKAELTSVTLLVTILDPEPNIVILQSPQGLGVGIHGHLSIILVGEEKVPSYSKVLCTYIPK